MVIVAKKYHENECLAHEEKDDERANALALDLTKKCFPLGIQILRARDITTYNEYQTYTMIDDEAEFVERVLAM